MAFNRIRFATQRHPKGRPKRNALSTVFGKHRSTRASDPKQEPDLEQPGENLDVQNGIDGQNSGMEVPLPGAGDVISQRRRIYFNQRLPDEELNEDGSPLQLYPRNKIRTAKYTPLTFVPKNLYFQFHNIANIYFLFIVILQIFTIFGASNPGLGAVPLIVILTVTAFKDALEDWRRTVLDNELNNTTTKTLHEWHNVNAVDENIGLWRRFKKATTRFIRKTYAKRKGQRFDPHELERSSTVIRLSEASERHPYIDGDDSFPMKEIYNQDRQPQSEATNVSSNPKVVKSSDSNNSALSSTVRNAQHQTPPVSVLDRNRHTPQKAKFKTSYWKNVRVGDFILLRSDDAIPADIVVLSTSDSDGACYVETKNLDGETNLKVRHALRCGSALRSATDCEAASFWIESEGPAANLYAYSAVAQWYSRDPHDPNGEPILSSEPINIDSMLLRGCNLKNTDWVIGVVIFTGEETKIMMNSGITPSKRSRIAKSLNWNVIYNFIILFIMCLISGIIEGINANTQRNSQQFFGFGLIAGTAPKDGLVTFWTCLILFQNLVPISLYISIEIVKTAQVFFIYSDREMYYEKLDYPCVPKSWNISDDLGQIEYIFSDKTGTLTQNVMEFKKCTVNGVSYGEAYTEAMAGMRKREGVDAEAEASKARAYITADREKMLNTLRKHSNNPYVEESSVTFVSSKFVDDLNGVSGEEQERATKEFMLTLALCHSVLTERVVEEDQIKIEFKAQSPDEAALVATSRDMGFALTERTQRGVVVHEQGIEREYEVLNTLEFNSSRKRMSAIVRMPDGRIVLLCKGADNVIYSRLAKVQNPDIKAKTSKDLEVFANEGLRTLCISKRDLTEEEYLEWNRKHEIAANALEEREARLEEVSDEIERELQLLGGTAIEDRLQDGVPDAIQLLSDGGIKIWVLTGDRIETAINIGFSCNLLSNTMELIVFRTEGDWTLESAEKFLDDALERYFGLKGTEEEIRAAKEDHNPPQPTHALVIDGDGLKIVLEEPLRTKFLLLCKQCKSVLCCRVSPSQKALVVRMVKDGLDVMTLSIGDGANDVAMIQEAHVGVGIAGEEGRQAVMSSDYAIGQFRFLSRLVLVHGRWSYRRIAEMVANFFYKNIVWTFTLFWYQIFDNFQGTYLYDYTYILLVNLVFTSLPVIFMGAFDQDVPAHVALKVPQLYKRGILQLEWTQFKFWAYMFDGLYQSAVCFFFPFFLYWKGGFVTDSGLDLNSTREIGVFVACGTVAVMNSYIMMNSLRWDWLFILICVLSSLLVWTWTGIYSQFHATPTFYKIAAHIFGTLSFWAMTLLMLVACLLPRFAVKTIQKLYFPYDSDIVREMVRLHQFDDINPSFTAENEKAAMFSGNTSSSSSPLYKSPVRKRDNYDSEDERPIYPPSEAAPSIATTTNRPPSPSDSGATHRTGSSMSLSRGHVRRSLEHERRLSHTSPIILEANEVR